MMRQVTAPELEAQLHERPDDDDAWRVYADWLLANGDVRGEMINLRLVASGAAPRTRRQIEYRVNALDHDHREGWLGASLAGWLVDVGADLRLTWRDGFILGAWLSGALGGPGSIALTAARLGELLAHPSARFLRDLRVGLARDDDASGFVAPVVAAIAGAGPLSSLRRLAITEENDDGIREGAIGVGDVSPVYSALPQLETLHVCGEDIFLGGELRLPRLRELTIETRALTRVAAEALAAGDLPDLHRLVVDVGDGVIDLTTLARVFRCEGYPALRHLGLRHVGFGDELALALADAPVMSQLASLDLSQATMTAAGARVLAEVAARHGVRLEPNVDTTGAGTNRRAAAG